jgi:hypothetical protein
MPKDGPVTAVAAASFSSVLDWLTADDEELAAAGLLGEVVLPVVLELPLLLEEQAAKATNAAADAAASRARRERDLCRDTPRDDKSFICYPCSQVALCDTSRHRS